MKKIFTLIIAFCFAVLCSNAQVMNISNSGHVLSAFKMSQNNVVWPENISGKQHLFMYKGNSASKIDMGELYTDFGSSYDIRNDKVVFVKNDLGAIDYYDGVSTSNLVPRYGGGPVIDDSHIAYYFATIQSPTFQQLIIKDGSNSYVTNCENMTMNGHYICLNQGVAAWDNGNGIKMFDGTNVISVSSSHSSPTFMKLSGKLIYADYGSGQNEDLFLYDGSSPVKMNTNRLGSDCQRANYEGHADIDSGKVVWIENRSGSDNGGGLDVYYYDGFTKHHLATSANSRMRYFAPRISGNNIIWFCEDEISPTHQIYLCHFDGTLIRNLDIGNPHNAIYLVRELPLFSGNFVAWKMNYDIYMADITTLPTFINSVDHTLNENDIILSQNPGFGRIYISLTSGSLNDIKIQILNSTGQLVHLETNLFLTAAGNLSIDASDLPVGLYVINLSNREKSISKMIFLANSN